MPYKYGKKKAYKPKAGGIILLYIIAAIILYSIYQNQLVPMPLLIFGIFFAAITLISIYLLMPSGDKEYAVIPIWRKK